MENHQTQSKPADAEQPSPEGLSSSALLAAFGSKILDELMQGEWEPDFEWQEEMLELAQKHGLLTTRHADQEEDPEEFDFMWERLAPVVLFPANEIAQTPPDSGTKNL